MTDTEQNKSHPMFQVSETDKPLSTSVVPGKKSPSKRDKRYNKDEQKREKKEKERKEKLLNNNVDNQNHHSEADNWPRFLVITSPTENNVPVSPYAMGKAIEGLTSTPYKLTRAKSGLYVVEVTSDTASKTLLNTKTIANQGVKITPHRSLNSSRGVITSRSLLGASDADLLDDLKNQGVSKVTRILRNRREPTNSIIITFNSPSPKHQVHVLNQAIDVKAYVALPMRCFKCQKFGHMKTKCTKKDVCPRCSEAHPENECKASTLKCPNCHGDHSSSDKKCPKYVEMKNILEISAKKRISVKDAKKEFLLQNGNNYAKIAASKKPGNFKKPTANHGIPQQKPQPTVAEPDLIVKEKLAAQAIAIRDLLKEQKEMKKAIDDYTREIRSRDEIINQQQAEIQRLTVDLESERRRKSASNIELELANAKLIQQESLNKKQQESIAELTRQIAQLKSKTQVEDKKEKDELKILPSISSDKNSSSLKTPCKSTREISHSMARSSSVKRSMSQSPGNDNDFKPSKKRDKKDSSHIEEISPSINTPSSKSKQSKSSDSNISPRTRSPSPSKRRNTSRSRSLERWTGLRDRSSHISFKIAPTPETVASPPSGGDNNTPKPV